MLDESLSPVPAASCSVDVLASVSIANSYCQARFVNKKHSGGGMDNPEAASGLSEEDALYIAKKDWSRVIEAASKSGYREGIEDGSESVFQEGFDKGYEDAFRTAFLLGKYKSLLNSTSDKLPSDIEQILDKTRRGACRICQLESEEKKDPETIPFAEIVNQQRNHSAGVLKKLHKHFQPVIEQLGIDMSPMQ